MRAAAADALGLLGSSAIKAGLGKNEVLAAMTGLVGLLSDQQPAVRIAALYRIDDHGSLYRPCSYRRLLVEENK